MPRKPNYNKEALERDIVLCENNIKRFQDAIAKEYSTIGELRRLILEIEQEESKE